MIGQRKKNARQIATAALDRFDTEQDYITAILNDLLPQTTETQRATDLVFGAIRNRILIDNVITRFADCPIERIQSKLLNVIRIASFELIYNPQTPEYSIVNEAVNTAKAIAGKKQTAFVNAVLRQITRHIESRQVLLSQADSKRTLPQNLSTGCQFNTDILPDPEGSPADYLSLTFSLPKWLIADWLNEFGTEQVRRICFASNRRPSIYIRPNTLKTTAEGIAENFRKAGVDFDIVPIDTPQSSSMIKLKSPRVVTELPGFKEGQFTVQDITASLPVRILNPRPEWTILDLCAAPGTKTAQLAELTSDSAKIIATDIDPERLKLVKENIARLGITGVSIVEYEEILNSKFSILNSQFDSVLLDVPCSNTGVLAKRIEARCRINPKAIKKLAEMQSHLLDNAAKMLKPKGKICYSTCSIQKAENSERVKDFLRQFPAFELESELLILPSVEDFDCDGGYVAVVARK